MGYEELVNLQGYVKIIFIFVVFIVFYSYAYSIYKRDKKGERDFEKYSSLALNDNIDAKPLENRKNTIK